jgi:hypothetical protein
MAKHEISTHADMQTPNAAAAVMWNTRTAPAEPSDAEIDDKILAVAEYVGITRDRIKAFVGAARMVGYDFVRTEAAYKRGKGE